MTEAGTQIGSGGTSLSPLAAARSASVPRAGGAPRAAPRVLPRGLHGRDPARARVRSRRRAARARRLRGRRGRRRPRVRLVRGDGDRRAGRGARARRGRRARRRRRDRRGMRAAALGRPLRPLPRGRQAPAAARAAAAHGDRAPARAPARARRAQRRVALDTDAGRARVHRDARRRRPAEPPHARRGEGDAPQRSRLSLLGGSQLRSATVLRFGEAYAAIVGVGSVEQDRRRRVPQRERRRAEPRHRARAPARALGEPRAHAHRVGRAPADAPRLRPPRRADPGRPGARRRRAAPAAAGLSVHPRGLPRAGARPLRRPLARLVELDRQLREIAHSLETKSVISRPLGEILHREVDNFAERTGISAELEIRGDPDSLSSAQRITVFRAIQEALANVREHASATHVSVRVRARRSAIELQIVDDGMGFEVERALAKAAQRGRLGLVGIGERVRMVGGTFELESQPGGPTSLKLTLPRWEPLRTRPDARPRRASRTAILRRDEGGLPTSFVSSPYRRNRCRRPVADPVELSSRRCWRLRELGDALAEGVRLVGVRGRTSS